MSSRGREISCRRCGEVIRIEEGTCPHCGASIRSRRGPIAMIIVGGLLFLGGLSDIEQLWVFLLVAVAVIFGGAYLLYERRQRLQ